MTDDEIRELRTKAEAANELPLKGWRVGDGSAQSHYYGRSAVIGAHDGSHACVLLTANPNFDFAAAIAHVAAFNPTVALRLLEESDRLRAIVRDLAARSPRPTSACPMCLVAPFFDGEVVRLLHTASCAWCRAVEATR